MESPGRGTSAQVRHTGGIPAPEFGSARKCSGRHKRGLPATGRVGNPRLHRCGYAQIIWPVAFVGAGFKPALSHRHDGCRNHGVAGQRDAGAGKTHGRKPGAVFRLGQKALPDTTVAYQRQGGLETRTYAVGVLAGSIRRQRRRGIPKMSETRPYGCIKPFTTPEPNFAGRRTPA